MRDRERVQKMQPQEYTETLSTMVGIVKDAWKELSDLAMKPCRWTCDHEVTRIKVIFLAASIDTLLYDFTNFIADCEKVLPQGYPFSRAKEVVFDGTVTIGLTLKELKGYLIMSDKETKLMEKINDALFNTILAGQELPTEV